MAVKIKEMFAIAFASTRCERILMSTIYKHFFFWLFQIYVEYVVKNPLCKLGEPITSDLFKVKLDDYIRGLPIFATRTSS